MATTNTSGMSVIGHMFGPERKEYVTQPVIDVNVDMPAPAKAAVKPAEKMPAIRTAKKVEAPQLENARPSDMGWLNEMSMPVGEEFKTRTTTSEIKGLRDDLKDNSEAYNRGQLALSGAKFMVDIMNAQSSYSGVRGAARLNIIQARNQAADAIYRGRQAAANAQLEGTNAGEAAKLAMAAQGQDVSGSGVGKIVESYEAMGRYNAMQEEINSYREALGYELEEVNYDYQIRQAAIDRDFGMIGAGLNFLAAAGTYGVK